MTALETFRMRISIQHPPNFDAIAAAFPVANHKAIFAWGDTIYNPFGAIVTVPLVAHETVHALQQQAVGGPEIWWESYIRDPAFRLHEEIPAHYKEIQTFCEGNKRRNARRKYLASTIDRMCSPLYRYDHLMWSSRARILLKGAIKHVG